MRRIVVSSSLGVVLALTAVVFVETAKSEPQSRAKAAKIVASTAAGYGNADSITEEELKIYLHFLASDQLEGRNLPFPRVRHRRPLHRQPPGGVGVQAGRQHYEYEWSAPAVPDANRAHQQASRTCGKQSLAYCARSRRAGRAWRWGWRAWRGRRRYA